MPIPKAVWETLQDTWPEFPSGDVEMEDRGQNHWVMYAGPMVIRVTRYPTPENRERLLREARLLTALHGRLPLLTPEPVRVFAGEPPSYAYVVYPRLLGVPLSRRAYEGLPSTVQSRVLSDCLGFLRALNGLSEDVTGHCLPRKDPRDTWGTLYDRVRAEIARDLPISIRPAVRAHFETFLAAAARDPIPVRLIHGDFGTTNLLHESSYGS